MMARAVIVQMTTVSMKGSNRATKPSETGRRVLTAECAMGAEPRPASFENAARCRPTISTPKKPPVKASGLKAPLKILLKAGMMSPALPRMTIRQANT